MTPPPGLTARRLMTDDLSAVIALHHLSRQGVRDDLIAHDSDAFFAEHVEARGRILGLHDAEGLAAYGVLGLPGPGDPNLGADHGFDDAALTRVAHVDGVAVHPRQRGCGLHRHLIRWRVDEARAQGRTIALTTAAPGNIHSLGNLLACGFRIHGLKPKFGGWRYLLRLDADWPAGGREAGRWLALDDHDGQQARLQAGWRGVALDAAARPRVLFRAPDGDGS